MLYGNRRRSGVEGCYITQSATCIPRYPQEGKVTGHQKRQSENLAELDGLLIGADDVEIADSALPEGGNGLDGVLSDVQSHLQGMLVGGIDVWRVQRPVVDGPGAHGRRLALPGLDGQMPQTQEGAAVLPVGVDADQLEPEFVGVEVDGLVQVTGDHARVLQVLGIVRHWSHDGRSFGTLMLRCFLIYSRRWSFWQMWVRSAVQTYGEVINMNTRDLPLEKQRKAAS